MKISFIVPCFNKQDYVEECLLSIMGQTYGDIEIICIDDRSTDDSLCKMESLAKLDNRIRIVKNTSDEQLGLSLARNLGIEKSTGDVIVYVDADDFVDTLLAEKVSKIFTQHPQLEAICCNMYDFYDKSNRHITFNNHYIPRYSKICDIQKDMFLMDFSNAPCWIVKKSVKINLGLYFTKMIFEDWDYVGQLLSKLNNIYFLNEPLYFYRKLIPGSITQTTNAYQDLFLAHKNTNRYLKSNGRYECFCAINDAKILKEGLARMNRVAFADKAFNDEFLFILNNFNDNYFNYTLRHYLGWADYTCTKLFEKKYKELNPTKVKHLLRLSQIAEKRNKNLKNIRNYISFMFTPAKFVYKALCIEAKYLRSFIKSL